MTKVTFLESPGSIDYCYVFGFHREFRLRPKIVKASRACNQSELTIQTGEPAARAAPAGAGDRRPVRQRPLLSDALPRAVRHRGHGQRAVVAQGQVPLPLQVGLGKNMVQEFSVDRLLLRGKSLVYFQIISIKCLKRQKRILVNLYRVTIQVVP